MFVHMYVCMYIHMYNVFKTADLALYVAVDAPGRVVPGDMTWQFAMPQCSSTSHQCDTVGEEGRGTHTTTMSLCRGEGRGGDGKGRGES